MYAVPCSSRRLHVWSEEGKTNWTSIPYTTMMAMRMAEQLLQMSYENEQLHGLIMWTHCEEIRSSWMLVRRNCAFGAIAQPYAYPGDYGLSEYTPHPLTMGKTMCIWWINFTLSDCSRINLEIARLRVHVFFQVHTRRLEHPGIVSRRYAIFQMRVHRKRIGNAFLSRICWMMY